MDLSLWHASWTQYFSDIPPTFLDTAFDFLYKIKLMVLKLGDGHKGGHDGILYFCVSHTFQNTF